MSADKLRLGIERLSQGILACVEKKLPEPALMLLYASIDITAWLSNDDPKAKVGQRFTSWIENYLFKAKKLECDSIDLYGARCGFLHTFTPDSDLSEQGNARPIAYAWGIGEAATLRRMPAVQAGQLRALQVEDLYEAWFKGARLLMDELQKDPNRAARVYQRAGQFFTTLSIHKDGRATLDA